MTNLPEPFLPTEQYLAAVLDELRELNQRIATMQPEEPQPSDTVELREPLVGPAEYLATQPTPDGKIRTSDAAVEMREPMTPGGTTLKGEQVFSDFPGAAALGDAGITLIADVPRTTAELTAIKGIGQATAKSILEALGE